MEQLNEIVRFDFSAQTSAAIEWAKTLPSMYVGEYTPIPESVRLSGLFTRSVAAVEGMTRGCAVCKTGIVKPTIIVGTLMLLPCCDPCIRKRDMEIDRKMVLEREARLEHRRELWEKKEAKRIKAEAARKARY